MWFIYGNMRMSFSSEIIRKTWIYRFFRGREGRWIGWFLTANTIFLSIPCNTKGKITMAFVAPLSKFRKYRLLSCPCNLRVQGRRTVQWVSASELRRKANKMWFTCDTSTLLSLRFFPHISLLAQANCILVYNVCQIFPNSIVQK